MTEPKRRPRARAARLIGPLVAAALVAAGPAAAAGQTAAGDDTLALAAARTVCGAGMEQPPSPEARLQTEVRFRIGDDLGRSREWLLPGGSGMKVTEMRPAGRPGVLFFVEHYAGAVGDRPLLRVVVNGRCDILGGSRIVYDAAGAPEAIDGLDRNLSPTGARTPLNPEVPPGEGGRACTRVGLIDNGVNYLLPEIAARLARDAEGRLVGHDFWEDDDRPFDFGMPPGVRDPRLSPFSPPSHGTGVASILLREAPPEVCAAIYRFYPPDPDREIGAIVARAAADGVRVLSLSSGRSKPWPDFLAAIEAHPQILFVAAAGNDGADLARRPLYPMVYRAANLLVVAATDGAGDLWRGSNWGDGIVGVAVRATDLAGQRFDGRPVALTGTSYAAPRIAALAGALAAEDPARDGAGLRAAIVALAERSGIRRNNIPVLTDDLLAEALR